MLTPSAARKPVNNHHDGGIRCPDRACDRPRLCRGKKETEDIGGKYFRHVTSIHPDDTVRARRIVTLSALPCHPPAMSPKACCWENPIAAFIFLCTALRRADISLAIGRKNPRGYLQYRLASTHRTSERNGGTEARRGAWARLFVVSPEKGLGPTSCQSPRSQWNWETSCEMMMMRRKWRG